MGSLNFSVDTVLYLVFFSVFGVYGEGKTSVVVHILYFGRMLINQIVATC